MMMAMVMIMSIEINKRRKKNKTFECAKIWKNFLIWLKNCVIAMWPAKTKTKTMISGNFIWFFYFFGSNKNWCFVINQRERNGQRSLSLDNKTAEKQGFFFCSQKFHKIQYNNNNEKKDKQTNRVDTNRNNLFDLCVCVCECVMDIFSQIDRLTICLSIHLSIYLSIARTHWHWRDKHENK